jgi:hypothetical protein
MAPVTTEPQTLEPPTIPDPPPVPVGLATKAGLAFTILTAVGAVWAAVESKDVPLIASSVGSLLSLLAVVIGRQSQAKTLARYAAAALTAFAESGAGAAPREDWRAAIQIMERAERAKDAELEDDDDDDDDEDLSEVPIPEVDAGPAGRPVPSNLRDERA